MSERDDGSRYELFVLGIAQDGGLPHVGCTKSCCEEARLNGIELYPSCLGIHDRETGRLALIEATPRVEPQLAALHRLSGTPPRERKPIDALLITHAHIGHYTGLIHFGREVCGTKELPTYVSPKMAKFLRDNGPWNQLVRLKQIDLQVVEPGASFELFPGLRVEVLEVPHRQEYSDTVAFRIHGPKRTVLFLPDLDSWEQEEGLAARVMDGVDVAYVDATWYDGGELPGRDMTKIPHPTMLHSMDVLSEYVKGRAGRVRFLHFNHSNPAPRSEQIRSAAEARGFRLAVRGERTPL